MKDRDDPRDATLDASQVDIGSESGPAERAAGGVELLSGRTFAGRYAVEQVVGRGGMGTVWRVRDQMVGEIVALKTLEAYHPSGQVEERALERFRREVRLARRISSPHVARTHDLGSQGGLTYLTMEYVEGTSLARVIEHEGAMPPSRAAKIALQIAEGLSAAHAAGVVHRDLKPDNVLVEAKTGRIVVTDFGIARALHDADAAHRTGGIVGTPLYMAPEQVSGAPVDARADVYALGLVLFEMLTGATAFTGATPIAAAVQRLHVPPRSPRSLTPAVPEELDALVLRCLERDPASRVADAATVARELSAWLALAGGESAPAPRGASRVGGSPSDSASSDATIAASSADLGRDPSVDGSRSGSTPSTTGQKPPVASLLKGDRALAVLAFAYRGPADEDWLPSGIRDELIDVLSRTRGLRVLGRGAVEKLKDERDPRAIGSALAVDFVVDGSAQVAGTKLRVTARLMDVATGAQIWSERFDSEIEDLFVVQERVGQRIAEALRLGMHAACSPTPIPPDALELYLRARRAARTVSLARQVEIVAMLEQVIERAPDFAPAYAAHAIACVRAWFTPHAASTRSWQQAAEESVARALERAPDLAETHFAQAQLMSQQGRYREAVRAAQAALGIAPTLPEAHQFLASLQLEAGRAKEGLQRIELALGLEPTLPLAIMEKSRWHGLYGDIEVFRAILAQWESDPASDGVRAQQMIRVGAYRGDEDLIRRGVEVMSRVSHPAGPYLILYARTMLGEISAEEGVTPVLELLRSPVSDRFRSLIHQMASEGLGRAGDPEKTLEHFRNGATTVLLDLEWIDRCPFLDCIRKHPEFAELRRLVRTRCEEIWAS